MDPHSQMIVSTPFKMNPCTIAALDSQPTSIKTFLNNYLFIVLKKTPQVICLYP